METSSSAARLPTYGKSYDSGPALFFAIQVTSGTSDEMYKAMSEIKDLRADMADVRKGTADIRERLGRIEGSLIAFEKIAPAIQRVSDDVSTIKGELKDFSKLKGDVSNASSELGVIKGKVEDLPRIRQRVDKIYGAGWVILCGGALYVCRDYIFALFRSG